MSNWGCFYSCQEYRLKGFHKSWWSNDLSYFAFTTWRVWFLSSKDLQPESHTSPYISRSLSPFPLSCWFPPLPRFSTFLKLILKNGLVGLSKSWIRSPLFGMSALCAPWNIFLKSQAAVDSHSWHDQNSTTDFSPLSLWDKSGPY